MSENQRRSLKTVLKELHEDDDDEFHYGACIGSDSQAVFEAMDTGFVVIAYPASDVANSKHGLIPDKAVLVAPMPALKRNHRIVENTDALVVTPQYVSEVIRSGTWATVRYARKKGKPIIYIWPDGRVQKTLGSS